MTLRGRIARGEQARIDEWMDRFDRRAEGDRRSEERDGAERRLPRWLEREKARAELGLPAGKDLGNG